MNPVPEDVVYEFLVIVTLPSTSVVLFPNTVPTVGLIFNSPVLVILPEEVTSNVLGNEMFPVPLGAMTMLPLLAETILRPLTSKLPPSCGVVSLTISVNHPQDTAVPPAVEPSPTYTSFVSVV